MQLREGEESEDEQGCCIAVGLASGLSVRPHDLWHKVIAADLNVKAGQVTVYVYLYASCALTVLACPLGA